MKKTDKNLRKSDIIAIGLVLSVAAVIGAFFLMTMVNYVKAMEWEVREPMSDSDKALYSNAVLLPGLADSFERYAAKGIRDCDYLVETRLFQSYDEMCAALPEGCDAGTDAAIAKNTSEPATDIKNCEITRYTVSADLPLTDREDLAEKYRYSYVGAFISYYVYRYPDNTWRFVVLIQDV